MWEEWVLDATMGVKDGMACFVPIEKDGSLVLGMNMIGHCPGKLVGVVHLDGQEAVERWIKDNPDWQKYANAPVVGRERSERTHQQEVGT